MVQLLFWIATYSKHDVEALKEQVTTLSTSYLTTIQENRDDISQNRLDISCNLSKVNDTSDNDGSLYSMAALPP